MVNTIRPFICERLGVDVNEWFMVGNYILNNEPLLYLIKEDGSFITKPEGGPACYLLKAINDPDLVRRIKIILSEDERAFLRIMQKAGARWMSRNNDPLSTYIDFWLINPPHFILDECDNMKYVGEKICQIPINCLPRMSPGILYSISEILE